MTTTPEPFEEVAAFHEAEVRGFGDEGRSTCDQDDSKDRPVKVRCLIADRVESSTTLVITRAEGEKETQIARSHHLRLGDFPGVPG